MLGTIFEDVRQAARSLRRTPAFTAAAVTTLALGLGASAAVFMVISAVLLRPLPYRGTDRMVMVWQEYLARGWGIVPVSYPNFAAIGEQAKSFAALGALHFREATLTAANEPERLAAVGVSGGMFQMLGVDAAMGRTFTPADDRPGGGRVAILSDGLWRRQFAMAPDVVGRTIRLDGDAFTIVGVMARGFALPPRFRVTVQNTPVTAPNVDIWIPLAMEADPETVGHRSLVVIGRLAPNVTLADARAEAAALPEALLRQFPGVANTGLTLKLIPFEDQVFGNVRRALWLLLGAVGLAALIACVNVAGMLIARAASRHGEWALRAALGASRGRLAIRAMTESLLLASLAGVVGLVLAYFTVQALSPSLESRLTPWQPVALDWRVLGFTFLITAIVGLAFGLIPRGSKSGISLALQLKRVKKGYGGTAIRPTARHALLAAQAATTVVLLVTAGLFLRSFYSLVSVDPGFDAARAVTVNLQLPAAQYPGAEQKRLFYEQVVARVGSLPDVSAVAVTSSLPLSGGTGNGGLDIAGRPAPSPDARPHAAQRIVDAAYFQTMGIDVGRGRAFGAGDVPGAPLVAIINESAARAYFPREDPLGQRIRPDGFNAWLSIVGVVDDVRHSGLRTSPQPEVFAPYLQWPDSRINLVLHASVSAPGLASALKREIASVDPTLPVAAVVTFEDLAWESLAESRLYTIALVVFAMLGLSATATGLYGLLSYLVAQQRHDIAVRMALGASARRTVLMVIREGVIPVALGIILGLGASIRAGSLVAEQLFEVTATDTLTLTAVPALLFAVALLACYAPARRAARVDPAAALRAE